MRLGVNTTLHIFEALDDAGLADKGIRAWMFLRLAYDIGTDSKVQGLLDTHRWAQGQHVSMAPYIQCSRAHNEKDQEASVFSLLIDGLKPELQDTKQHFRIHWEQSDDINESVETCLKSL